MYDTLVQLLTSFLIAYELDESAVLGHREVADQNTACPGKFFDLDKLRADIRNSLLEAGEANS